MSHSFGQLDLLGDSTESPLGPTANRSQLQVSVSHVLNTIIASGAGYIYFYSANGW